MTEFYGDEDGKRNLVLFVSKGESVVINDKQVTLTVTECGLGGCKIGFLAGDEVKIDRRKIYEKKKAAGTY